MLWLLFSSLVFTISLKSFSVVTWLMVSLFTLSLYPILLVSIMLSQLKLNGLSLFIILANSLIILILGLWSSRKTIVNFLSFTFSITLPLVSFGDSFFKSDKVMVLLILVLSLTLLFILLCILIIYGLLSVFKTPSKKLLLTFKWFNSVFAFYKPLSVCLLKTFWIKDLLTFKFVITSLCFIFSTTLCNKLTTNLKVLLLPPLLLPPLLYFLHRHLYSIFLQNLLGKW